MLYAAGKKYRDKNNGIMIFMEEKEDTSWQMLL
jgi:hypothetical protein